jgi:ribosomal protein L12E/L44/L45/RPP1/RPP2
MPSPAHDTAVARIVADPELLSTLAEKILGSPLPTLPAFDSTARIVRADEIRPDAIFAEKTGPWNALEVQDDEDPDKIRRWPLLVSALHSQRGCMGDLVVLTARAYVARWAEEACVLVGPRGTELRLKPVVLLLTEKNVGALLDEAHPELAFFAAWAVHHRHGRRAERLVRRALGLVEKVSEPLRKDLNQGIFNVLNPRLCQALEELNMGWMDNVPEGEYVRDLRLRAEAKATRQALLTVLEARGLEPSEAERATVAACSDPATLDTWIRNATRAATTAEALVPAPPPAAPPAEPAAKPRARKRAAGKTKSGGQRRKRAASPA